VSDVKTIVKKSFAGGVRVMKLIGSVSLMTALFGCGSVMFKFELCAGGSPENVSLDLLLGGQTLVVREKCAPLL
jgi:hypothetical protein